MNSSQHDPLGWHGTTILCVRKDGRVAMAGDYCVLRGKTPAALVECGFISNPKEEKQLLDEEYQRRIAQAIAKGIYEYSTLKKSINSSSN